MVVNDQQAGLGGKGLEVPSTQSALLTVPARRSIPFMAATSSLDASSSSLTHSELRILMGSLVYIDYMYPRPKLPSRAGRISPLSISAASRTPSSAFVKVLRHSIILVEAFSTASVFATQVSEEIRLLHLRRESCTSLTPCCCIARVCQRNQHQPLH